MYNVFPTLKEKMNSQVAICIFIFVALTSCLAAKRYKCPQGGEIYEWGINSQGKVDVVNAHNRYRQMIMNGQVRGQPRGKNLKPMKYDRNLGLKGQMVSQTCEMEHVTAKDSRWEWVGQNLYIEWSSVNTDGQNWDDAVTAWFNEHENFRYPAGSNGKVVGHYTQVVWADSEYIGCDFIKFYDRTQPRAPYAKLYTCNYGPGGNYVGEPPYERA